MSELNEQLSLVEINVKKLNNIKTTAKTIIATKELCDELDIIIADLTDIIPNDILTLIKVKNNLLKNKEIKSDEMIYCKKNILKSLKRVFSIKEHELTQAILSIERTPLSELKSYNVIIEEAEEINKNINDLIEYIDLLIN